MKNLQCIMETDCSIRVDLPLLLASVCYVTVGKYHPSLNNYIIIPYVSVPILCNIRSTVVTGWTIIKVCRFFRLEKS